MLKQLPHFLSLVLLVPPADDVIVAMVQQWELRGEFARRLSALYGKEVPAYATLLDVAQAVNRDVLSDQGADAERLGISSEIEIRTPATATEGHLQ